MVGEDSSEPMMSLLAGVASMLEPIYGFASLLRFKLKFAPRLEPLYLTYPQAGSLPAIGRALTRAYVGPLGLRQQLGLASSLVRPEK